MGPSSENPCQNRVAEPGRATITSDKSSLSRGQTAGAWPGWEDLKGNLQDKVLMPSLTADVCPLLSSWTKIVCAVAREALTRTVRSFMVTFEKYSGRLG